MVWPCPLPADACVAAGSMVEFPRPDCPSCAGRMVFWPGYRRHVRACGRCQKMFVPRLRCGGCRVSHALLPAFVLAWRLDAVEAAGTVIAAVACGGCGVRPAAAGLGVPYTTARGWCRRFTARGGELGVAFAALAAGLGGEPARPADESGRFALAAITAAFDAAGCLPGWAVLGVWRLAPAVSGGKLLAASITSPWLIAGRWRFMPPVPPLPA